MKRRSMRKRRGRGSRVADRRMLNPCINEPRRCGGVSAVDKLTSDGESKTLAIIILLVPSSAEVLHYEREEISIKYLAFPCCGAALI